MTTPEAGYEFFVALDAHDDPAVWANDGTGSWAVDKRARAVLRRSELPVSAQPFWDVIAEALVIVGGLTDGQSAEPVKAAGARHPIV